MWELHDITVQFGTTTAMHEVSLTISPNEILVILGPSGCGKSTLLRVLSGLQPPTAGEIWIEGSDATARPPHQRGIGVMFQDPTLFPHRSVGQNIAFGLRMAGVDASTQRRRVDELLELVDLHGFAERGVENLSGGEAQRVALARSLAPEPSLLLLDEPFAALDRTLRDRLVSDLPEVLDSAGTAAVHVTHDHDEAFAIADRVAVMSDGHLLRTAPPAELFADPRTETVARFLGHTNIVGDGRDRRVIRRDAATIDPAGDMEATVTASVFRGDHHDIAVVGALGELRFRLTESAAVGSVVRLRIDPTRVAPLSGD